MIITFKRVNVHAGTRRVYIHIRLVRRNYVALGIIPFISVKHWSKVCVLHIKNERIRCLWHNHKSAGCGIRFLVAPVWWVIKRTASTAVKDVKVNIEINKLMKVVYNSVFEQAKRVFLMSMSLYMSCHELDTTFLVILGKNVFSV